MVNVLTFPETNNEKKDARTFGPEQLQQLQISDQHQPTQHQIQATNLVV